MSAVNILVHLNNISMYFENKTINLYSTELHIFYIYKENIYKKPIASSLIDINLLTFNLHYIGLHRHQKLQIYCSQ